MGFLPFRESLKRSDFALDSNTTSESVSLSDKLVLRDETEKINYELLKWNIYTEFHNLRYIGTK